MTRSTHHDIKLPSRADLDNRDEKTQEDFIIQPASVLDPSSSSSPSSSHPNMTIGKALLVLSHSNPSDWVYAVLENVVESPSWIAFLALDRHITLSHDAATTIAVSLLDQAMNTRNNQFGKQFKHSTPHELFYWLFLRHPVPFTRALQSILQGENYEKLVKLSLCESVLYIMKRMKNVNRLGGGETDAKSKREDLSVLPHFCALLGPLLHIMNVSSKPTRLSVAAAETFCTITREIASLPSQEVPPPAEDPHSVPLSHPHLIPCCKKARALIVEIEGSDTKNDFPEDASDLHEKARPLIVEIEGSDTKNDLPVDASAPHSSVPHLLMQELGVLLDALHVLVKWYEASRSRLSKALQEIIASYEAIQGSVQSEVIIARSWKLLSAFISFVPTPRQTERLISEYDAFLKDPKAHAGPMQHYSMLCLQMLCSALVDSVQVVTFLETRKTSIFPFLITSMKSSKESEMAVMDIFQLAMFESGSPSLGEYVCGEWLPNILLVEYQLSFNSVDFIVRAITRYGQSSQMKLLLMVIEDLKAPQPHQKANAMNIVVELIKCEHNNSSVKELIQNAVVDICVHDHGNDLHDKIADAGLFQYLDPEYTVPKLACIAQDTNHEAALQMLVAVCAHASNPFIAFKALLDSCRNNATLLHRFASSPADIGGSGGDSKAEMSNQQWTNQVMNIITEIAPKISASHWSTSLPALVQLYLDNTQDTLLVTFLAKISSYIGQYLNDVLPMLIAVMKSQRSLTEEMLKGTAPESVTMIKELIFERLAPLLVLKVVPYTYFATLWGGGTSDDIFTTLHDLLILRMTQVFEFEEVRRVSALVLSYLPLAVWALPTLHTIQDMICKKDYYTAKIFIFTWFNALSIQGKFSPSYTQLIVSTILSILVIPCPPPSTEVSEVQKLHFGAIDCLAVMMKTALSEEIQQPTSLTLSPPVMPSSPVPSPHRYNDFFDACRNIISSYQDILQLMTGLALPPYSLWKDFHILETKYTETKQQFCMGLVSSIINCIKACEEGHAVEVAKAFLKPLLDSIVTPNISTSLLQGYLQAVNTIISKLKERVSLFGPIFSDFLAIALTNKAFQKTGLVIAQAIATHDQKIVSSNNHIASLL